jgi:hypothetical protein
MYTVVTERQYIPSNKNGDCNFLVLESDDDQNESKFIYVMIDHISTIELIKYNRIAVIHLYIVGRPHIVLREDQRETVFDVINSYMEESDEESNSDSNSDSNTKNNKKAIR